MPKKFRKPEYQREAEEATTKNQQGVHPYDHRNWHFDVEKDVDLILYNSDRSQKELSICELEEQRRDAYVVALRQINRFFGQNFTKFSELTWDKFEATELVTTWVFADRNGESTRMLYPVVMKRHVEIVNDDGVKVDFIVEINIDAVHPRGDQEGPRGPHVGYKIVRKNVTMPRQSGHVLLNLKGNEWGQMPHRVKSPLDEETRRNLPAIPVSSLFEIIPRVD